MDFDLTPAEREFQTEARAWLKTNVPREEDSDAEGLAAGIERRRAWQRKLYDAGYLGLSWPKEYGGCSATLIEQMIFNNEAILARAPAPRSSPGRR